MSVHLHGAGREGMSALSTTEDYEVTLATLHSLVARRLALPAGNDHARGYLRAMRDVKAILDKHGTPPGEPVYFGEYQ